PEAKVLLTVRNPENWYRSVNNTIYRMRRSFGRSSLASRFRAMMVMIFFPRMWRFIRMVNSIVWEKTFHNRFEEKSYAIDVFQQHIEEVKQLVPPDRLLIYDVTEGWEPLCAFLGVE